MTISQRKLAISIIHALTIMFGVLVLGKPYQALETVPIWLTLVVLILMLWRGSILHRSAIGLVILVVSIALVVSRDIAVAMLVYGVLAYVGFGGIHALGRLRERQWITGLFGLSLVLISILGLYWLDVASIVIGLLVVLC